MGISMPSSSNWHSSAGRHKKKTLIIFKMHQSHLFDHFLLVSQAIYLQQTDFHWHQRAAPAPGRCWWRNPGPRSESASHGTCKRSPGSLAGSPGFGSAPQRVLEPRITLRWSVHTTNLQTTEENRVRFTNQTGTFIRRFQHCKHICNQGHKKLLVKSSGYVISNCILMAVMLQCRFRFWPKYLTDTDEPYSTNTCIVTRYTFKVCIPFMSGKAVVSDTSLRWYLLDVVFWREKTARF